MVSFDLAELQNKSGEIIKAALDEPASLTYQNEPFLVLMSADEYTRLSSDPLPRPPRGPLSRLQLQLEVVVSAAAYHRALIGWTGAKNDRQARDRFFEACAGADLLFRGDAGVSAALLALQEIGLKITGWKENSQGMAGMSPDLFLKNSSETNDNLLVHFPAQLEALKAAMRPYADVA